MTQGIDIHGLSFRYDDQTEALTDVSLSARPGDVVALLGHNGSGKSTLVKHLNGLLRPSEGTVLIHRVPTQGRRTSQLAKEAALLFQNPDDQICKGTVWEEVIFGPTNLGFSDDRTQALANRFLELFDLLDSKDRNPHDLGLSERKRLAIASVMAMDTGIVVLDEPTAGLDAREISQLEIAVQELQAEDKIVIIISHDMDFVAENASRAICLEHGRKRFDGSTIELFGNAPLLERCGLFPPQVVQLSNRLNLSIPSLTPEGFCDGLLAATAKTPDPI